MNEGRTIDAHSPGKAGLIVGLAEQMGVVELFNENLSSGKGRREDVPYGILALMMMVNMWMTITRFAEWMNTTALWQTPRYSPAIPMIKPGTVKTWTGRKTCWPHLTSTKTPFTTLPTALSFQKKT